MDYWAETMQDDCYLIAADGWKAETYRVLAKNAKGKEVDKGWTCDLVPKSLIVARYFAAEQEAIHKLEAELENVAAQITELEEENGGDDGVFAGLEKINKANITAEWKKLKADPQSKEDAAILENWLKLNSEESLLKAKLKAAEDELDALAYAKYPTLGEDDIKTLVVDDKWLASLESAVHGEMDRISQALTQRVTIGRTL